MQIFRFPTFCLCLFYPTGINIGSKRPQHVLKHAEKQAETRRVQSFGANFGVARQRRTSRKKICAQGARVSGPPAQQFKKRFESPDASLLNAV